MIHKESAHKNFRVSNIPAWNQPEGILVIARD